MKKIFISCVSSQFRACRDALANDLRAIGAEVVVQESFTMHGRTLLDKLEEYISNCDRVIALVGDAYGWEPDSDAQGLPSRRSYTQWEYFFAKGQRLNGRASPPKETFVYFASSTYLAENAVTQAPELAEAQQSFADDIKKSGKDHHMFSSLHELRAAVLRDGFEIQSPKERPQNMPFTSIGELFKGRGDFINKLRQKLVDAPESEYKGRVMTPIPALDGMGGVGKTRLAVEFAWRYQESFSALLFVAADSPTSFRANLAALSGPYVLNLDQQFEENEDQKIAAALRWLAAHPGWFLIVDNVDTNEAAEEVIRMLTRFQNGRVLITSRLKNWKPIVEPLDLNVLSLQDSQNLLLELTAKDRIPKPDDAEESAALVVELDGLALAIEQAGAYISKRRISIGDYRKRLSSTAAKLLHFHDRQKMEYPRSVAITLRASREQVSDGAKELLQLLSWYSPEVIPLSLLEAEPELEDDRMDAVCDLEAFSLVKRTPEGMGITLHRLVQEISREEQISERAAATPSPPTPLVNALALLDQHAPDDPKAPNAWLLCALLEPHMTSSIDFACSLGGEKLVGQLARRLGRILHCKANYLEAEERLVQALKIDSSTMSARSEIVARDHVYLSRTRRFIGKLDEAEKDALTALKMDEAASPPNDAAVAEDLICLGEVYFLKKRLSEREPLYRRALELLINQLGEEHYLVSECMNNLASALQDARRMDEAEALYERSIRISEKVLPPDDHEPGVWLNNLGTLLSETGRKDDAEAAYRRSLVIFERSRTPNHPQFAMTLLNLAGILKISGRKKEALEFGRRALAIRETSLGLVHEETINAMWNVLNLMLPAEDLSELHWIMTKLVKASIAAKQDDHLKILLRFLQQLSSIKQPQDAMHPFGVMFGRLLIDCLEALPEMEVTNAAQIYNDVAKYSERLGDWTEAERVYQLGVARFPSDVILAGNLAFLFHHVRGDLRESERIYCKTLSENPKDAINHANYAGLCLQKSNIAEASRHIQEARKLHGDARDHYSSRISFIEALLAIHRNEPFDRHLSELKRLFEEGVSFAATSVARLLESLPSSTSAETKILLAEFEAAMRSRAAREKLASSAAWISIPN